MEIKQVSTTEIIPYEKNAKLHPDEQVEWIANSIREFGFKQPLVLDKNNVIVIGHGRLLAAKKLGMKTVPCVYANDLNEEQIKALRLADNKTNESLWDFDLLTSELDEIALIDMSDFGFEDIEFDEEPIEIVEDDAPEDVETRCKLGDIWQLGDHRLICGDSTDMAIIDRLMDGAKAELLLTDPPYNMEMGGHGNKISELGKRSEQLRNSVEHMADFDAKNLEYIFSYFSDISIYIFTSKNLVGEYLNYAKDWDFNILVWNKTNPAPLVNNTFLSDLEYIMFFYKGKRIWNNGLKPFDIYSKCYTSSITEGSEEAGKVHPTMKPIKMLSNFVRLSSNENDTVIDLFGGSGSTLIACEQLNRRCYMCELDPHYCDVIIQRWENFTGQEALKIDGN